METSSVVVHDHPSSSNVSVVFAPVNNAAAVASVAPSCIALTRQLSDSESLDSADSMQDLTTLMNAFSHSRGSTASLQGLTKHSSSRYE